MKGINILIIDGDKIAAKALAHELKLHDYQVSGIATSGQEAIEKVTAWRPNLIITNTNLPGQLDGITTSQKIQASHSIPVIYLSSCRDRTTLKRARVTNPKGYLIKPYNPQDLQAAIEDTFSQTGVLQPQVTKIKQKAKLAVHKLKRVAHQDFHLPSLSDRKRQIKRAKYRHRLSILSTQDREIVRQLNREGVYQTSLAELQLPHTKRLVKELEELYPQLYTLTPDRDWRVSIAPRRKYVHKELLFWALAERLLDIVENYIGLPLLFHSADLRRDVADAPITDARQWHLDIDDDRMIKIIIYLNNVGKTGGAFEYISRSLTPQIVDRFNYKSGFISEGKMAEVIPAKYWQTCVGQAGSIIITDPANIFHRARPAKKNRYSLTFGYTSRIPKVHLSQFELSASEWQSIQFDLSQRQIACLRRKKD